MRECPSATLLGLSPEEAEDRLLAAGFASVTRVETAPPRVTPPTGPWRVVRCRVESDSEQAELTIARANPRHPSVETALGNCREDT